MNFLTSIYREASIIQLAFFWISVGISVLTVAYVGGLLNLRRDWGGKNWIKMAMATGLLFNKDPDMRKAIFNPHVVVFQVLMFALWFLFCMWLHWYLLITFTAIWGGLTLVTVPLVMSKYSKKELEGITGFHPTDHDDDAACNAM